MTLLNISRRCLVKIEIANEELIAYSNNSLIPEKFSLIGVTSLNFSMNQLTSLPTALPEGLEVL